MMAILAVIGPVPLLRAAQDAGEDANTHTVDLRPHFKPGRTARYKVWTMRTSDTKGPRRSSQRRKLEVEGEITWRVQEVQDDGSATCSMTIEWMTCTVTASDGSETFNDSREGSGEDENLHRVLVAMSGVPFTFEVAGDGMVQSVAGTDAVHDATEEGDPVPEDLDFIESATDLALLAAAPRQIESGGAWDVDFTWTDVWGKVDHQMKYSLSSVETVAGITVATVHGEASVSFDPDLSKVPAEAPQPDFELTEGKVESQVMFDLSRHEAVGRNTIESRSIRVTLEGPVNTVVIDRKERTHSQVLRIAEQW